MQTVAHSHESSQTMHPVDRVRRQVALRLIPQIAELLYKADKANDFAELDDLRSEGARAVYLADALLMLEPDQQRERMKRVHAQDAHGFALAADEGETAMRQARQDIAAHGQPAPLVSTFGTVRAGHCQRCKQVIAAPAKGGTLFLSADLKVQVHCACIADEIATGKVERTGPFQFRVVEEGEQQ